MSRVPLVGCLGQVALCLLVLVVSCCSGCLQLIFEVSSQSVPTQRGRHFSFSRLSFTRFYAGQRTQLPRQFGLHKDMHG
jgi:hypothetical protein